MTVPMKVFTKHICIQGNKKGLSNKKIVSSLKSKLSADNIDLEKKLEINSWSRF